MKVTVVVGMGAPPKWRDNKNGETATRVNAPQPMGEMRRWNEEMKWDKDRKTTMGR